MSTKTTVFTHAALYNSPIELGQNVLVKAELMMVSIFMSHLKSLEFRSLEMVVPKNLKQSMILMGEQGSHMAPFPEDVHHHLQSLDGVQLEIVVVTP